MSYVSSRLGAQSVLDADSHLMEAPDWLYSYADPEVRSFLDPSPYWSVESRAFARVVEQMMPGASFQHFSGTSRAERLKGAERQLMAERNYRALGAVDPAERPRALDLLGVEKQIVFSTSCSGEFYCKSVGAQCSSDPKLLYGGARAHNRGMAEFCSVDDRLIATGFVPLEDPAQSVKVLEEALALGCGAIYLPHAIPDERSWSHPDYEGFWARLAEAGVPMVLHVGTGDTSLALPKALYNNGRPAFYTLGDHTWQIPDVIGWHWPAELMLTQLVFDGVFERFPELRCGVIELRANWVPSLLDRLDFTQYFAYSNPLYKDDYKLPMRASDYIRRQVKFTPWAQGGDPLATMIDGVEGGERLFMFSTDWPHTEGGEDPIAGFEAELAKLAGRRDIEDVRDRFYRRNFAELMGL